MFVVERGTDAFNIFLSEIPLIDSMKNYSL